MILSDIDAELREIYSTEGAIYAIKFLASKGFPFNECVNVLTHIDTETDGELFMFSIFITRDRVNHKLGESPFLDDAIISADFYAATWTDPSTTFNVWRGGNLFYSTYHGKEPQPIEPEGESDPHK